MNAKGIIEKLKNNNSNSMVPPKSSAVIIPLLEINGELHVLFEVRSHALKFQPGEVCFPGGRIEKEELPLEAALRELKEELLITIDNDQVLCALTPLLGPAGALVYPFVALLTDYNMTFSQDEVDRVFTYPVSFFKNHPATCYPMERQVIPPDDFPYRRVTGGSTSYAWHVQKYDMWIYEDTEPVVWGFTGRLLHSFMELI